MIKKETLVDMYFNKKLSMKEISKKLGISVNKVSYWMRVHDLSRRSISESVYLKNNPKGDPFSFTCPGTQEEAILFGLGLGLYWGEGTKANKYSVRLGNTDPKLVITFILFLETFFKVPRKDMRFGIQVFNTTEAGDTLKFWKRELKVSTGQFMKTVITPSRGIGSYKRKIEHGVLTVYYNNKKMRDVLVNEIEKLRKIR